MTELLLTIDDLRAMQRSVGIWLPGFAVSGEGLGLRGELDLEEVIPIAEAFSDAVLAVEVLADRAGAVTEYAYSISASGARGLMEAMPRGLVGCSLPDGDPVSVVASVAGLSRELVPAEGLMWTVSAGAYQRCDSLALAGDEEGAVAALTRAEVSERSAKAWVAALCGRGSAAAVTVVRREPEGGRLEAGELRFVADSLGGAWRITSDEAGYTITPVDGSGLLAALRELMRQERS
ncbi:MAG TPA: hypothetical protein VFC19_47905 [Candidatus Limnocylindrales bacterium]|nr:hypothetical protein [Candidatus Limnocylindrales bacterium]